MTFCDNCAAQIPEDFALPFTNLPFDVESACEGESGVVCGPCAEDLAIVTFPALDTLQGQSPAEALDALRQQHRPIRVELGGLDIPSKEGRSVVEMASRLRQKYPAAEVTLLGIAAISIGVKAYFMVEGQVFIARYDRDDEYYISFILNAKGELV